MKMSLCDMFDVDHPTLFIEFASKPVHTAYTWAVYTLTDRVNSIWSMEDRHSLDNVELRKYLSDAIDHYQGNLDEFYHMQNSSLREDKLEPQLLDLINTIA